ncbi:hypothetical protein D3C76_1020480 [compost metagenome]
MFERQLDVVLSDLMRRGHAENVVPLVQGRHLHAMEMQVGDLVHAVVQADRHGAAGARSNQRRIVIAIEHQGDVALITHIDLLLGRGQRGVGHAAGIVGEFGVLSQSRGRRSSGVPGRTTAQCQSDCARAECKETDAESSGHDRDLR